MRLKYIYHVTQLIIHSVEQWVIVLLVTRTATLKTESLSTEL